MSTASLTLEQINTAIQEAAASGVARVTVGPETVESIDLKTLMDLRDRLLSEQSRTRLGGGHNFQKITPVYP